MSLKKSDHLYLVDGSGYIFRAFHALPPLTRKSDKLPVGAVAGFCNMLVRLMDDMAAEESPTHLAVIFDASGKTFRNDIYPDYKANRDAPPEDLIPQFPLVREAVKAFGIPSIELQGYEADDLIAAYTHAATQSGARVSIVSSDKDLMQLVTDRVNMIDTMKDRKIGPAEVLEKFEVGPERVIDVQSLAGDSVDNVPGVPGIGIKTAALLINEYGDLETLLERAGEIKQNKRRENLIEFAEQARISRELVTLRTDTPLPVDMSEMGLTPPEAGMLMGFLKAMEFNTLTRRVSKRYDINADDYEASSDLAAKPTAISSSAATEKATSDLPPAMTDMPPIDSSAYECVTDMAVLDNWIEDIIATGYVAIDTETDGLDAVSCRLVGISLATRPGHACYIPLAHGIGEGLALADDVPSQLAEADVLARLKPLLQDASIMKILQNAKFDLQVLGQRKIEVHPVEDTMLMSYALAAGQRGHGMDELSELYLGHKPISIKELLGTGKSQITFDQVPLEKATPYAAEDADITFRLWQMMRPELVKDRVVSVYQTTEKPLVPVIVDMEKNGICVDRNVLSRLPGEFAQKMAAMEFISSQVRRLISPAPNNWAIFYSTKWGCLVERKPKLVHGGQVRMCWKAWRLKVMI